MTDNLLSEAPPLPVPDAGPAPVAARDRALAVFDAGAPVVEYGPDATPAFDESAGAADGVVVVLGQVHGRPTLVIAYDIEVLGGSHGVTGSAKVGRGLDYAGFLGAAVVMLAEGGGHRADEPPFYTHRRDLITPLLAVSGRAPVVGVATGPVYDTRAVELGVADVIIAVRGASIGLAEPGEDADLAEYADVTALEREGVVDLVVDDTAAAIVVVRRYLDLILRPQGAPPAPDPAELGDALRRVVPENPRRAIDGRRLTDLVADPDTVLRLRERFGGALQTSLARLGGRAVGLVASHSMVNAGAIDSPASDKFARFLTLCDTFGLPVVYLTDVPGLLAGPVAEQTAMNRHSTRPYFVQTHSRVPQLVVVIRRAYGQGMVVMGMGGHVPGRALQVLWPTAEFGGMGLGGAAAITASSTNSAGATGGRSEEELYRDLMEQGSARRMAQRFATDEAIEPEQTRLRLLAAIATVPVVDGPRTPRTPIDAW